jgi:hypothetical protein
MKIRLPGSLRLDAGYGCWRMSAPEKKGGGLPAYPPWPWVGGFGRFKIREAGGLAGNPLPPDLSNAPVPGVLAENTPDEPKGLAGFPDMSKPKIPGPYKGGLPATPPLPCRGGRNDSKRKVGRCKAK